MNRIRTARAHPTLLLPILLILLLTACGGNNQEAQALEHIERGQTYADQGQFRAAMIEMRNAIESHPESPDPVLELANIMLTVGGYSSAADLLEPWLDSERNQVSLPLARAYVHMGKHVSAREVLTNFEPQSDSERSVNARLLGEAARMRLDNQAAINHFEDALQYDPVNAEALAGLMRVNLQLGNYQDVIDQTGEWTNAHGAHPRVLHTRSRAHYELNQLEPASDTLVQALEAVRSSDIFLPERRQILTLLSRTLTEQGRANEAMIYNQILAEHTRESHQESLESAVEAISAGNLATARSTLQELLQVNPDSQLVGLLLGAISLQEGDLEGGESLLTENLDAEVASVPFIQMAAMAQVDRGKRNQAIATLERAMLARPSDADLLSMHGVMALADPTTAAAGVESLNKALQIDDDRSRLRVALAQHYLQQDQVEQALGYLRAAFDRTPDDWPATNFYLTTLINHDRSSEIREVRDQLTPLNEAPAAGLLIAIADHSLGDTQNAKERLQALHEEFQGWPAPAITLARLYRSEGATDEAIEWHVRAAERTPEDPEHLQQAGRLYSNHHTPEEVLSWLNSQSERNASLRPAADALKAQIHALQGNHQTARDLIDRHMESDLPFMPPFKAQISAIEARAAGDNEDWPRARSRAAEAVSLEPDELNHRLLLARVVGAAGNGEEALTVLDETEADLGRSAPLALTRAQVVRIFDSSSAALNILEDYWADTTDTGIFPDALSLARQVEPQRARSLALEWSEQQPQNNAAWRAVADMALMAGDEEDAADAYREAVALNPEDVTALNNLAWILRESANSEARELAERAAELAPQNAAVLDTYGWILHLGGDSESAHGVLSRAADLSPANEGIRQHLSEVESAL